MHRLFLISFPHFVPALFLIFVAAPSYVYWLNSGDISWQGYLWLSHFAISVCFALILSVILFIFFPAITRILKSLVLVIYTFLFVRAFFFPESFGSLDGVELKITKMSEDYSLWIATLAFIVLFFIVRKYTNIAINFMQASAVSMIALVTFIYMSHSEPSESTSHLSRFSSNTNVIVFSFDSIQNDLLVDLLSEDEKLESILSDFTMYTDVVAHAPNTRLSLLSTLAGRYIPVGVDGSDFSQIPDHFRRNALPNVMARHDYEVDVFGVDCDLLIKSTCLDTSSLLPKEVAANYRLTAYEAVILRVIPKSLSWNIVSTLSENYSQAFKGELTLMSQDKEGHGFGVDKYIFNKMYDDIYLVDEPVFKFHHYKFSHQPIRFDGDCSYSSNTPQNIESAKAEITCVLNEFNSFLNQLKNLGIYEDAVIVLTSDHGYEYTILPEIKDGEDYSGGYINNNGSWSASRYWPVLLLKRPGSQRVKKTNNASVQLIDIVPTIYDLANVGFCQSSLCDGVSVLEANNPRKSPRNSIFYVGGYKNIDNKFDDTKLYLSRNISEGSYDGIKDAMVDISISDKKISCGQTIFFNEPMESYAGEGFFEIRSWGRWSDANKAKILFNSDEIECPENKLVLNLRAPATNDDSTTKAKVFLNGVELGNIIIHPHNRISVGFELEVSAGLFRHDKPNILDLRMDKSGSSGFFAVSNDARRLGLGFESLVFQ